MSEDSDLSPADESRDSAKPVMDYATPLNLVTLCRMRVTEADLAKAKLESEGIECIVRDQRFAIAEPLLLSDVPLLVRDSDLERAREILATPAPDAADGDYVEEAWRCPKCHRRRVDLLPLSPGRQQVRIGCLAVVALPVFLTLITVVAGKSDFSRMIEDTIRSYFGIWMLIAAALSLIVLLTKRKKHCNDCGHEWMDGAAAARD